MFTQVILDQVVVQKSFVTLNVFALGLLLFSIWRIGLTTARQYMLDYFSNRFDLTLISGFINHTLLLPLKFFESRRVGDIITRVQENRKVQLFITRQAILSWLDALMAVVYIGLMFYYNWQLTLLVLSLIPPIIILTLVATPWLRKVSREIFNASAAENSLLVEMLTGVAIVKAAAAERQAQEDRDRKIREERARIEKEGREAWKQANEEKARQEQQEAEQRAQEQAREETERRNREEEKEVQRRAAEQLRAEAFAAKQRLREKREAEAEEQENAAGCRFGANHRRSARATATPRRTRSGDTMAGGY